MFFQRLGHHVGSCLRSLALCGYICNFRVIVLGASSTEQSADYENTTAASVETLKLQVWKIGDILVYAHVENDSVV